MPTIRYDRLVLAAAALAVAAPTFAQDTQSSRWSCTANGIDVTIQVDGEQATITRGSETRVLKREAVDVGTLYSDKTLALRMMVGTVPQPANAPLLIERGQATNLGRCYEIIA